MKLIEPKDSKRPLSSNEEIISMMLSLIGPRSSMTFTKYPLVRISTIMLVLSAVTKDMAMCIYSILQFLKGVSSKSRKVWFCPEFSLRLSHANFGVRSEFTNVVLIFLNSKASLYQSLSP